MYANVCWRTLQFRNYINEDHVLSPWGEALAVGLEKLRGYPNLYESLILGLELVRFGVLHHEDFSVKYSDDAMPGSGTVHCGLYVYLRCGQETYSVYLARHVYGIIACGSEPLEWTGEQVSASVQLYGCGGFQ